MIFELLGAFAAGFAAAGLALAAVRLSGGRAPKWLIPVAAGLAMLGAGIWLELSWAERTRAQLPAGFSVVEPIATSSAWRPWTYLVPQVERFAAFDLDNARTRPDAPNVLLVELYLFARWRPVERLSQFVDCGRGLRADFDDGTVLDERGAPPDAAWVALDPEDRFFRAACKEQAS